MSNTQAQIDPARRRTVARAVKSWINQLIDLTGRNQLLYYKTLRRGTLELGAGELPGRETLLADRTVKLSHLFPDTADEPARFEDATRRAGTIHRKAVELFEERGIETLYLAWGMATWTTDRTSATPAAPVLVRPLKIEPRDRAETDFELVLHGDWTVNETLLHLLATDYSTPVDPIELLELLAIDGTGPPDPAPLWERLVKEAADVADFTVTPRLVAGTFSYTKLPMVRDLKESVDALAAHDIIAAVAGVEEAAKAVRAMHARDIDASDPNRIPPQDEFLVLPTDASQNYVINAAVAGEPLVIQGPPGTGKSQTIANLIATLTARGQKVLFVAEKRAAIDAVTKRLAEVGLDGLVMDLHGGVTSKRQFAQGLAETLERIARTPAVDLSGLHDTLTTDRQHLLDHDEAMHQVHQPWRKSFFGVQADLFALSEEYASNLRFSPAQLRTLDIATFRQARDGLHQYVELGATILHGTSPWTGANITTPEQAQSARAAVSQLAADTAALCDLLEDVADTAELDHADTLEGWSDLVGLLSGVRQTLEAFQPELFDAHLDQLANALAPAGRGPFARAWAAMTDGSYRAAKKTSAQLASKDLAAPQLHGAVQAARKQAADWRARGGTRRPFVPPGFAEARQALGARREEVANLTGILRQQLTTMTARDVAECMRSLARDHTTLVRLPQLHELEGRLRGWHVWPFVRAVQSNDVPADEIGEFFTHAWLTSLREHLLASHPRLAAFDGKTHHRRARQYAEADRKHIASTPARVLRAASVAAVVARDSFPEQDDVIRAQAKRKRSHMSLRRFFEEAPEVLTALRPCWAMSPLIVSQTLPARKLFDVVIFDEASQVTPADAVPALLRAHRAVVAGDDRQLPPTAFFDSADGDGDEDEDDGTSLVTGFESILDVLGTLLRSYMLTWHYRSHDERLIAFSNTTIYKGALTTFPGAAADDCLSHILVSHEPGGRTNSPDAEVAAVVNLMIDHARTRPKETLGVIAMGMAHGTRVDAALRERLRTEVDPALTDFFDESRAERAFVKNLERVQGDERDAIILSVGYGKLPDGRMSYRFGPINQEGGERRLNVAVTRARKRMTVVSSFSHTDMDPERTRAEGADLLRRYLKYAETAGAELEGAGDAPPLNPFELAVLNRMEAEGLRVLPQYGASGYRIDFAICHPRQPGRFVLAVETDGAAYHSTPTARDRDRLREEILTRLGWRFHRIWSTDWFNDPDAEMRRLMAAYNEALADTGKRRSKSAELPAPSRPRPPKPVKRGPRPAVPAGLSITEYSHDELVAMARWIKGDTLPRTEDELRAALMAELGFKRRGKRIIDALTLAIRDA